MTENFDLVREINQHTSLALPAEICADELRLRLSAYINQLIQADFQKLIVLLYRIDVSEPKLKALLAHNPGEDAGKIIAALIIERQVQKIRTRAQRTQPPGDFTGEERW